MSALAILKLLGAAGVLGPLVNVGMGALKNVLPVGGWQAAGVQALVTGGLAAAGTALGLSPVEMEPMAAAVVAAVPMGVSQVAYQASKKDTPLNPDWWKS